MVPAEAQIVLGTASLGTVGERGDAYRLLDAFIDQGGRIIDTAVTYSDGVSGEIGTQLRPESCRSPAIRCSAIS